MATEFYVSLFIGDGANPGAADGDLLDALTEVEAVRADEAPCGFRLTFETEYSGTSADHPFLKDELLVAFKRVRVEVGGTPITDGYITDIEISQDGRQLFVTGEDVSVMMSLVELAATYEGTVDSDIASTVIGRYSSLGVTAKIVHPAPDDQETPVLWTPIQVSTDLSYLRRLAKLNGCKFYIRPGPNGGSNTAYWGKPEIDLSAQDALIAPGIYDSNVIELTPVSGGTRSASHYGARLSPAESGIGVEVVSVGGKQTDQGTKLAKTPTDMSKAADIASDPDTFANILQSLTFKMRLLGNHSMSAVRSGPAAQGETNRSVLSTVGLRGELDTLAYGDILDAPGVVGIRGVGDKFDGDYYVKEVTHQLKLSRFESSYHQKFELTREGLGTTTQTL